MKKITFKEKGLQASIYKKSLLFFSGFCLICCLGFLGYVYTSLVSYENNLVENYITDYFINGEILEHFDADDIILSEFEPEKSTFEKGFKQLFENEDVKIKKNNKESNEENVVYEVLVNDKTLAKLSLISTESTTKMAILKIDHWQVTQVEMNLEQGIYSYEITLPKTYSLFINDQQVLDLYIDSFGDVEGLKRVTDIVPIHPTATYKIDGFITQPTIKVLDENQNEVELITDGNKISVKNKEFEMIEDEKEAKKHLKTDFDILGLAKNWSLFLTDDLGGAVHGFYQLTPYLIEDTYMYEMAYGWSHNVDITFVSEHTFKNFTNEKVSNFIFYNDKAFSCEVYLEKNMRLYYGDKQDIMYDRLYFVYQDGGYKLVDMQSLEKK